MITSKGKAYLTSKEAADLIGRSQRTVYQKHKLWQWHAYKMGATLIFLEADVKTWLSKQIHAIESV